MKLPFYILTCALFFTSLSAQELKHKSLIHADSLQGFDEVSANERLINNAVYVQEYAQSMQAIKRNFIKNKYYPAGLLHQSTQHAANSRPIGETNTINNAPCVNEGFESTLPGLYAGASNSAAIAGWAVSSYTQADSDCFSVTTWTPGSPEVWLRNGPRPNIPGIGTLNTSPLGGNYIQMQNDTANALHTRLSQTIPVTASNCLFEYAFAGAWLDAGHNCCLQPGFEINVYDHNGALLNCASTKYNPASSNCSTHTGTFSGQGFFGSIISWTDWQTAFIDLVPFIGTNVTIEIVNHDCLGGSHYGMLFFDSKCATQALIGNATGIQGNYLPFVNYCSGSNQAVLTLPSGYISYQWSSPSGTIPASQGGTAQTYTVTNPVLNSAYTASLMTTSGCPFVVHDTIRPTTVHITGIEGSSACSPLGAGTASVAGSGSGMGYTYTWLNAGGTIVSTTSVMSNVPPGTYSVSLNAIGSTGCGSASQTISIGLSPLAFTYALVPSATTICAGQSFTTAINIGGNPNAYLYTWSPNTFITNSLVANAVISPSTSAGSNTLLVYTVVVTPTLGSCPQTQTFSLFYVNLLTPTIAPVPELCKNAQPVQIQANPVGGVYSTGLGSNSPISPIGIFDPLLGNAGIHTFTYMITSGPCMAFATGAYHIDGLPTLAVSGKDTICLNETIVLQASGADTYYWSTGAMSPTVSVSPATATSYSITGTNAATGCSVSVIKTVDVVTCTGINSRMQEETISIYPNPSVGEITIQSPKLVSLFLYNSLGESVLSRSLQNGTSVIDLSAFPSGVYFLKTGANDHGNILKIVKIDKD